MKKFIIWDYNIQSYLFLSFFIMLVLDFWILDAGYSVIIYSIIGIYQLITSNKRFFAKKYTRGWVFTIYYYLSMTFMILLLLLICSSHSNFKIEWIKSISIAIVFFGFFGTPVLAIVYYFICHYDYKKVKQY